MPWKPTHRPQPCSSSTISVPLIGTPTPQTSPSPLVVSDGTPRALSPSECFHHGLAGPPCWLDSSPRSLWPGFIHSPVISDMKRGWKVETPVFECVVAAVGTSSSSSTLHHYPPPTHFFHPSSHHHPLLLHPARLPVPRPGKQRKQQWTQSRSCTLQSGEGV